MNSQQDTLDDHVDDELFECLNLAKPKSFFLFAGAGSGKTRSLINVLNKVRLNYGIKLRTHKQKVAIITYTNAACNEIIHRLEYDVLFKVSTIHSFVWDLISNYQNDIRLWLEDNLKREILELQELQKRGRSGTKAEIDRASKIDSKSKRLLNIPLVKIFSYSPSGDNRGRDSLNHSEVLALGAYFLSEKPLMQKMLVKEFPILLIDESQDTNKSLIEAFFEVQKNHRGNFSLGLFGDVMQKIYNDGKNDLGINLPTDWIRPAKKLNYRCPKRVVQLINKIRFEVDGIEQVSKSDQKVGVVRLFIVKTGVGNKALVEMEVSAKMAEITNDEKWTYDSNKNEIKVLTIEHHMAASRMGFLELFEPLYKNDRLSTGVMDGSLSGLRFFTQIILPLVKAKMSNNDFEIARIVKRFSPFFSGDSLKENKSQVERIKEINLDVQALLSLWDNNKNPRLLDILKEVDRTGLFEIPNSLSLIVKRQNLEFYTPPVTLEDYNEEEDKTIPSWEVALATNFDQIEKYYSYVTDSSAFGTHQGVKGLEFPRVMVILDDEEARGFMFSYEKLFGAKSLTSNDANIAKEGKETSIERTRRLFYVTCSRAKESLAIIAYTNDPAKVKSHMLSQGWFELNEITEMS